MSSNVAAPNYFSVDNFRASIWDTNGTRSRFRAYLFMLKSLFCREKRMPATSGRLHAVVASVAVATMSHCIPARAADVIAEWSTIQMPPAPTLKAVTVDPKSTALLLFDFMTSNCGERPRCVAAVPTLKALHDRARAANMLVAYTLPGGGKIIDPS